MMTAKERRRLQSESNARLRAKRRSKGLCRDCSKKAVEGRVMCKKHLERERGYNKKSRARQKAAALRAGRKPVLRVEPMTPQEEMRVERMMRLLFPQEARLCG